MIFKTTYLHNEYNQIINEVTVERYGNSLESRDYDYDDFGNKIKTNITATSKTLVMLTENILSIKNNKIVLDYGNYTKPKIFYINDKLYISTNDLQTQRVLLFDSKGNSIGGFPVYGSSASTIDDIDNDSSLELAVTAEANQLLIYKFN